MRISAHPHLHLTLSKAAPIKDVEKIVVQRKDRDVKERETENVLKRRLVSDLASLQKMCQVISTVLPIFSTVKNVYL